LSFHAAKKPNSALAAELQHIAQTQAVSPQEHRHNFLRETRIHAVQNRKEPVPPLGMFASQCIGRVQFTPARAAAERM